MITTVSPTGSDTALLSAHAVTKSFTVDGRAVEVLHGVDLSIANGEFVTVMGPSGSGKSTLLYGLSGMDAVDAGTVRLDQVELTALTSDLLADHRREHMGFVFQQPTMLRDLGLLENIVLTSSLDRVGTPADRVSRAEELMRRAGIWDLRARMPAQVSGGQLQRAGICRALMRRPRIVFGDEPTGSLNRESAEQILDLLTELNRDGTTMLVVTHDVRVAARADRVVFMIDGRIVDELGLTGDAGPDLARVDAVIGRMRELGI
ncbi:ABC transporter ATP-binding protein [Occultella glacieicola]|uniref:ABC transporter ATP-binding protein n=2 Tax=Occultella glacieicola TaxID=2518684 RepID=A0ABY2E7U8_9MICO|nr:ABC transporter ATP-binding protein [Occultella glacieicola]